MTNVIFLLHTPHPTHPTVPPAAVSVKAWLIFPPPLSLPPSPLPSASPLIPPPTPLQSLSRLGYVPRPTWLRAFALKSAAKLSGLSIGMIVRMVEAMWGMR